MRVTELVNENLQKLSGGEKWSMLDQSGFWVKSTRGPTADVTMLRDDLHMSKEGIERLALNIARTCISK